MSNSRSSSWWTVECEEMANLAIVSLVPEEQQRHLFDGLGKRPATSRSVQEYLQYTSSLGYHFDELKLFEALFKHFGMEDVRDTFLLWLLGEVLPRFQGSTEKLKTLESSVQKLSERTAKLVEDLSISATIDDGGFPVDAEEGIRQLGATLMAQKHLFASEHDSETFNRDLQICMEPCFKNFVSRVESLEQMVKENREGMKLYQPVTQGEELAARVQALENKIKELQPPFSMLSDAAESSTCTLTPASTVVNDSNNDVAGFRHAEAATAAPLRLRVAVYNSLPGCSNSVSRLTQKVLVKMYPHTPFRFLTDKLAEKFGDHQLSSSHSGQSIFDSETPKSLGLGDSAELTYSNTVGSKTIDLTVM
ncbi:hypothetical protein M438DRAFT_367407 [Aureobasidium pullulans EXF-150]|uniref:Uncharacterized protein n=1 Tax=Aureobasidium pullulans EXF-150 TaxID=1043002 RepID=A0A074X972_AURPU|nr:uncharacterized protein M438DRAFT_367407 [Aureobasidium pullulans EXF-150]KEQ81923.1 hypothetical protein M438DRAFT_367407 [Aureobasidium pullulans EXF-150]